MTTARMSGAAEESSGDSEQDAAVKEIVTYAEIIQSKESTLDQKTAAVQNGWSRVIQIYKERRSSNFPLVFDHIYLVTAKLVLMGDWLNAITANNYKNGETLTTGMCKYLDELVELLAEEFPIECRFCTHLKPLLDKSPWSLKYISGILNLTTNEDLKSEELFSNLWRVENETLLIVRLECLCTAKSYQKAFNLALVCYDQYFKMQNKLESDESSDPFYHIKLERGKVFYEELTNFFYLLLCRISSAQDREKHFSIPTAFSVLSSISEVHPKRRRIASKWREWKKACKTVSSTMADLLIQKQAGDIDIEQAKSVFYHWIKHSVKDENDDIKPAKDLLSQIQNINTDFIYIFADVIHERFQSRANSMMKVVELYIRAMTQDINQMEKSDVNEDKVEITRLRDKLASRYLQLAEYFCANEETSWQLTLTAFSLSPSDKLFDQLFKPPQTTATDPTLPADAAAATPAPAEPSIVLTPAMNDDLQTIITNPRWKSLCWEKDKSQLERLCRQHLETGGRKIKAKEDLKHLHIDYDKYNPPPVARREPDDNDYGFEKGYEPKNFQLLARLGRKPNLIKQPKPSFAHKKRLIPTPFNSKTKKSQSGNLQFSKFSNSHAKFRAGAKRKLLLQQYSQAMEGGPFHRISFSPKRTIRKKKLPCGGVQLVPRLTLQLGSFAKRSSLPSKFNVEGVEAVEDEGIEAKANNTLGEAFNGIDFEATASLEKFSDAAAGIPTASIGMTPPVPIPAATTTTTDIVPDAPSGALSLPESSCLIPSAAGVSLEPSVPVLLPESAGTTSLEVAISPPKETALEPVRPNKKGKSKSLIGHGPAPGRNKKRIYRYTGIEACNGDLLESYDPLHLQAQGYNATKILEYKPLEMEVDFGPENGGVTPERLENFLELYKKSCAISSHYRAVNNKKTLRPFVRLEKNIPEDFERHSATNLAFSYILRTMNVALRAFSDTCHNPNISPTLQCAIESTERNEGAPEPEEAVPKIIREGCEHNESCHSMESLAGPVPSSCHHHPPPGGSRKGIKAPKAGPGPKRVKRAANSKYAKKLIDHSSSNLKQGISYQAQALGLEIVNGKVMRADKFPNSALLKSLFESMSSEECSKSISGVNGLPAVRLHRFEDFIIAQAQATVPNNYEKGTVVTTMEPVVTQQPELCSSSTSSNGGCPSVIPPGGDSSSLNLNLSEGGSGGSGGMEIPILSASPPRPDVNTPLVWSIVKLVYGDVTRQQDNPYLSPPPDSPELPRMIEQDFEDHDPDVQFREDDDKDPDYVPDSPVSMSKTEFIVEERKERTKAKPRRFQLRDKAKKEEEKRLELKNEPWNLPPLNFELKDVPKRPPVVPDEETLANHSNYIPDLDYLNEGTGRFELVGELMDLNFPSPESQEEIWNDDWGTYSEDETGWERKIGSGKQAVDLSAQGLPNDQVKTGEPAVTETPNEDVLGPLTTETEALKEGESPSSLDTAEETVTSTEEVPGEADKPPAEENKIQVPTRRVSKRPRRKPRSKSLGSRSDCEQIPVLEKEPTKEPEVSQKEKSSEESGKKSEEELIKSHALKKCVVRVEKLRSGRDSLDSKPQSEAESVSSGTSSHRSSRSIKSAKATTSSNIPSAPENYTDPIAIRKASRTKAKKCFVIDSSPEPPSGKSTRSPAPRKKSKNMKESSSEEDKVSPKRNKTSPPLKTRSKSIRKASLRNKTKYKASRDYDSDNSVITIELGDTDEEVDATKTIDLNEAIKDDQEVEEPSVQTDEDSLPRLVSEVDIQASSPPPSPLSPAAESLPRPEVSWKRLDIREKELEADSDKEAEEEEVDPLADPLADPFEDNSSADVSMVQGGGEGDEDLAMVQGGGDDEILAMVQEGGEGYDDLAVAREEGEDEDVSIIANEGEDEDVSIIANEGEDEDVSIIANEGGDEDLAILQEAVDAELSIVQDGENVDLAIDHDGEVVDLAIDHDGEDVDPAIDHDGEVVDLAIDHDGGDGDLTTDPEGEDQDLTLVQEEGESVDLAIVDEAGADEDQTTVDEGGEDDEISIVHEVPANEEVEAVAFHDRLLLPDIPEPKSEHPGTYHYDANEFVEGAESAEPHGDDRLTAYIIVETVGEDGEVGGVEEPGIEERQRLLHDEQEANRDMLQTQIHNVDSSQDHVVKQNSVGEEQEEEEEQEVTSGAALEGLDEIVNESALEPDQSSDLVVVKCDGAAVEEDYSEDSLGGSVEDDEIYHIEDVIRVPDSSCQGESGGSAREDDVDQPYTTTSESFEQAAPCQPQQHIQRIVRDQRLTFVKSPKSVQRKNGRLIETATCDSQEFEVTTGSRFVYNGQAGAQDTEPIGRRSPSTENEATAVQEVVPDSDIESLEVEVIETMEESSMHSQSSPVTGEGVSSADNQQEDQQQATTEEALAQETDTDVEAYDADDDEEGQGANAEDDFNPERECANVEEEANGEIEARSSSSVMEPAIVSSPQQVENQDVAELNANIEEPSSDQEVSESNKEVAPELVEIDSDSKDAEDFPLYGYERGGGESPESVEEDDDDDDDDETLKDIFYESEEAPDTLSEGDTVVESDATTDIDDEAPPHLEMVQPSSPTTDDVEELDGRMSPLYTEAVAVEIEEGPVALLSPEDLSEIESLHHAVSEEDDSFEKRVEEREGSEEADERAAVLIETVGDLYETDPEEPVYLETTTGGASGETESSFMESVGALYETDETDPEEPVEVETVVVVPPNYKRSVRRGRRKTKRVFSTVKRKQSTSGTKTTRKKANGGISRNQRFLKEESKATSAGFPRRTSLRVCTNKKLLVTATPPTEEFPVSAKTTEEWDQVKASKLQEMELKNLGSMSTEEEEEGEEEFFDSERGVGSVSPQLHVQSEGLETIDFPPPSSTSTEAPEAASASHTENHQEQQSLLSDPLPTSPLSVAEELPRDPPGTPPQVDSEQKRGSYSPDITEITRVKQPQQNVSPQRLPKAPSFVSDSDSETELTIELHVVTAAARKSYSDYQPSEDSDDGSVDFEFEDAINSIADDAMNSKQILDTDPGTADTEQQNHEDESVVHPRSSKKSQQQEAVGGAAEPALNTPTSRKSVRVRQKKAEKVKRQEESGSKAKEEVVKKRRGRKKQERASEVEGAESQIVVPLLAPAVASSEPVLIELDDTEEETELEEEVVVLEEVGDQLEEEVGNQLEEEVGNQLEEEVGNQLEEEVGNQLEEEVGKQLEEEVGNQLEEEVGNQLEEEVGNQLEEEVGDQLEEDEEELFDLMIPTPTYPSSSFYTGKDGSKGSSRRESPLTRPLRKSTAAASKSRRKRSGAPRKRRSAKNSIPDLVEQSAFTTVSVSPVPEVEVEAPPPTPSQRTKRKYERKSEAPKRKYERKSQVSQDPKRKYERKSQDTKRKYERKSQVSQDPKRKYERKSQDTKRKYERKSKVPKADELIIVLCGDNHAEASIEPVPSIPRKSRQGKPRISSRKRKRNSRRHHQSEDDDEEEGPPVKRSKLSRKRSRLPTAPPLQESSSPIPLEEPEIVDINKKIQKVGKKQLLLSIDSETAVPRTKLKKVRGNRNKRLKNVITAPEAEVVAPLVLLLPPAATEPDPEPGQSQVPVVSNKRKPGRPRRNFPSIRKNKKNKLMAESSILAERSDSRSESPPELLQEECLSSNSFGGEGGQNSPLPPVLEKEI